jgi:hypothetical protein
MNYSIKVSVYNKEIVNLNEKNKDGSPADARYENRLVGGTGFNLKTASSNETFTGAELKAKIKERLKLSDDIIEVKLTSKGKELNDGEAVTSYGVVYSATNPYVARVKPETPVLVEAPAEEPQAPAEEPQAPAEEPQAPAEEPQAPAEEPQAPSN